MAVKTLKLKSSTNVFGTKVTLESNDRTLKFVIGDELEYDPTSTLSNGMTTGYLFRSPNLTPTNLSEIWETVSNFTGAAELTAEYDTEKELGTAWMRIAEKGDATMFAFAHSLFEKWSDEKDADARKQAKDHANGVNGKLNADGTVRVTIDVTTLGD